MGRRDDLRHQPRWFSARKETGGFSCKIHLTVEGLGNPLRVILTPGQRHESTQAEALIGGFTFEKILADRGYAGAEFIAYVQDHGSEAVIPPHQRAKVKREYDTWVYRRRHLGRMLLQQTQALSPHLLALRETGPLLSRLRSVRVCARLVTLNGPA